MGAAMSVDATLEANARISTLESALAASEQRAQEAEARAAWRDIESAPKDGTWIVLLTFDSWNQPRVFMVAWQKHKDGDEGWNMFLGGTEPTFWQPLPDPPDRAREARKEGEGG
jgi:hypothetical protein